MRFWMPCVLLLVSLNAVRAADPPDKPLPPDVVKALADCQAAEAKAKADCEKAMAVARDRAIKALEAAQKKVTAAGDLDGALAIKARVEQLKAPPVVAVEAQGKPVETSAVPGPVEFQAAVDKVKGRFGQKFDEMLAIAQQRDQHVCTKGWSYILENHGKEPDVRALVVAYVSAFKNSDEPDKYNRITIFKWALSACPKDPSLGRAALSLIGRDGQAVTDYDGPPTIDYLKLFPKDDAIKAAFLTYLAKNLHGQKTAVGCMEYLQRYCVREKAVIDILAPIAQDKSLPEEERIAAQSYLKASGMGR